MQHAAAKGTYIIHQRGGGDIFTTTIQKKLIIPMPLILHLHNIQDC